MVKKKGEKKRKQQQHFLKKRKRKKEKKKEEEKREKQTKNTFSTNKKEEARNVSEQRDKSAYTIQSIQPTATRQGNIRSRTTPHKERMSGSLNIETTLLTRTS